MRQHTEVFFLDTETTSADPEKARVVQFAIVTPYRTETKQFEFLVKPPVPIEVWAMETHHITEEMVADSSSLATNPIASVLLQDMIMDRILVAHNAPYDIAVLANEGFIVPNYIDTLRVARHVLDDPKIEKYQLQYLRYFYNLDELHKGELEAGYAHSALYDTIVLKWFYEFLEEEIKKFHLPQEQSVVERMIELTNTPVLMRTFSFGKYRGEKIADIAEDDIGYLEWLCNSEMKKPEHERNADMIHTLKHYLN